MTTPASGQNQPSKMKRLISGNANDSVRSKLPRASASPVEKPVTSVSASSSLPAAAPSKPKANLPSAKPPARAAASGAKSRLSSLKLLPAFWTVASVISITVNVVLLIALLLTLQTLRQFPTIPAMASDQLTGVLGGLYTNFVKMDEANIRTNIHVEKEIPVQFSLNVSGPTDVTLSRPVTINGALVTVQTGGLNIVNARATIVLPEGLVLPINIQNLVVPVDQRVLAVLDVPVDIPLDQTELHEPFVGLQKVVEPWYCLLQKMNGFQVCPANPAIANPTPVGTVIP